MLNQGTQALAYSGISLFLPLIRNEVGLTFTQAGTIAAASSIVYALMQIPAGFLADRLGAKGLFMVGLIGTNVMAFNFAELHQYWPIVGNQAVSGFFRSIMFAPGLLLITTLFPRERRATAIGLYVAGGFTSNIFLYTLGPLLVGPIGWRNLFMIFSGLGMILAALFWRVNPAGTRALESDKLPIREIFMLFRHRVMWAIGAIQYVRLAVAFGLNFWLPTFLVIEKGYSLQTAGLVVAAGALVTASSNFVGGYVSDRLRNPLLVIGTSLAMLAITTFLLVHVDSPWLLFGLIVVNAFFVQLYFGPLFSFPIDLLGSRIAGTASGFGNSFANIGGFSFVYLMGTLKDATGTFAAGLYSISGLCIFGLLCTILLSRLTPRRAGTIDQMAAGGSS
jgi:predicted MFS family arabinose efflux permease